MKYQIPERECKTCGQVYAPTSTRQKYCADCGRRKEATCEYCGKRFSVVGSVTGRYCSRNCFWTSVSKPERQRRPCVVCGKVFKPKKDTQKTCSLKCSGISQRTRFKVCKVCGTEFVGKNAMQVTCSHECAGVLRRGPRNTHCERCGKEMPYSGNPLRRFCSQACRQIPIGTRIPAPNGYMYLRVSKEYPTANNQGNIFEHRYVMEQSIGRSLEKHEFVHHINGDRKDNRIENLELWTGRHLKGVRIEDGVIKELANQPEIQELEESVRQRVLDAVKRTFAL